MSRDVDQRARFAEMFFRAQAKVHARKVPAYLREALPDEVLVRLTKESGLPREAAAGIANAGCCLAYRLARAQTPEPNDQGPNKSSARSTASFNR